MVRLRIVSDTAPATDAATVEPSLEDLFLYHFGEDAQRGGRQMRSISGMRSDDLAGAAQAARADTL